MKVMPRSCALRDPVREGHARFGGDQRAGAGRGDRTHPRFVADQAGAHHAVALGRGQEGVAQPDQPAGRDRELEADVAPAVVDHVEHARPAATDQIGHDADERFGGVDHEVLDRFALLAVDLFGDDLRARDLELVPLAPHRFDQDRKVQLAATGDGKDVRLLCRLDPQREIRLQLADRAARAIWREVEYFASRPAKGEVLTPKVSFSVGSSTSIASSASGAVGIGQGRADLGVGEPGDRDDVAGDGLVDLAPPKPIERRQRSDLLPCLRAVRSDVDKSVAGLRIRAAVDPADRDPAAVRVVVERGDQQLTGASGSATGAGISCTIASRSGRRSDARRIW